jgi:enterobacterial common antigen flippase
MWLAATLPQNGIDVSSARGADKAWRQMRALRAVSGITKGRSAAAAIAQILFARMGLLVVNFGTGIIVARVLAPAGRGEQAAMSLWPPLLTALATFGIPTALRYLSSQRPGEAGRLLGAASFLGVCLGCGVAGVGTILVPHILPGYSVANVREAQLLMLFAPQLFLSSVISAHFESVGNFSRSNIVMLTPSIATFFVLLGLAGAGLLNPATAPLAYFVPGSLLTAWFAWKLWPRMASQGLSIRNDARLLLSYGLRSYALDVLYALQWRLDQAVIIAFLSPAALGLYTIGLTISRIPNLIQGSLGTVLFPKASGLEPKEAIVLVSRMVRISNLVSGVATVLFVLIVPELLPFFYGHRFSDAVGITRVLTFEAFFGGAAGVVGQAFMATGRPQISAAFQAVWFGLTIALLVVLVPRTGLEGAAVALLLSSLVCFAMNLAAYPLVLREPIPRLIPTFADLAYLRGKVVDVFRSGHASSGY